MNPGILPEKKAAKVDLSPLFLPRQPPMPNREAVSPANSVDPIYTTHEMVLAPP